MEQRDSNVKYFLISAILLRLVLLSGCETMEAVSSGEFEGKGKASNYSYGLPDRYRAGVK